MKATSMDSTPGPLVLLGGMGLQPEFTPALKEILARVAGPEARIIILLLAQTEQNRLLEQRVNLAEGTFSSLGIPTLAIGIHTQQAPSLSAAVSAVGEADCIFVLADRSFTCFPGQARMDTNPGVCLWDVMWERYKAGMAVMATAGVAAMLGQHAFVPTKPYPPAPESLGYDLIPGAGVLPGAAILPYFNHFPSGLLSRLEKLFPIEATLIGIDEQTALVSGVDGWYVAGFGRVSILIHNQVGHVAESGQHVPNHLVQAAGK